MIRKLRWKVVGITMLFVGAILLAVFGGVYTAARTSLQSSTEQQLRQALQYGAGELFRPGQENGNLPCFVVEVYPTGTVHFSGSSYYRLDEAQLSQIVSDCLTQEKEAGVLRGYQLRYLRSESLLSLRIAFADSSLEQATLRALVRMSLLIGAAAMGVLLVCCYFLAGHITVPVERAWKEQRRFLSDASHELKTPLTVILSSAELLGEHIDPDGESMPYVENIRTEGQRMRALVEDMLALSRMESGQVRTEFADVDLSDVVTEAALRFEPVAYEAGRRLEDDIAENVHLSGERSGLYRLTAILLDNAVKYAPADTAVRLRLYTQDRQAIIEVENGGEPIPPEAMAHLFERFYRADGSRSDHGSFGLGLSIAQAIAQNHGGTIRCRSDGRGTCFAVALPLKRTSHRRKELC